MADLKVVIRVLEAYGLQKSDVLTQSDPLVVAKFKGLRLTSARTTAINNTSNPVWNQELILSPKKIDEILLLKVYDKDIGKNDLLGYAEIPLSTYFGEGMKDMWLQLVKKKGLIKKQFISVPGHLHVQIFAGNSAEVQALPNANYCQSSFQNSVFPNKQTYTENVYSSAHQPVNVTPLSSVNNLSNTNNSNNTLGSTLVGKTTTVQQPAINQPTNYAPQLQEQKIFTETYQQSQTHPPHHHQQQQLVPELGFNQPQLVNEQRGEVITETRTLPSSIPGHHVVEKTVTTTSFTEPGW